MTTIASNLQTVQARILTAASITKRDPESIQLLAVSKTFPVDAIREAYAAGQTRFAENYVQESIEKIQQLADLALEWHFIGPIQSNKTRPIAEHFAWVHSVDRLKIAERLSSQRPADLPPLQICLQVNISQEDSKSGTHPDQLAELAHAVAALPNIQLRGLMTVPAPCQDPQQQTYPFAALRNLLQTLNQQGLQLDTLSMGMSDDFPAAIAEGATFIRIGSAIFGSRTYPTQGSL